VKAVTHVAAFIRFTFSSAALQSHGVPNFAAFALPILSLKSNAIFAENKLFTQAIANSGV
jgi:hypothetical protein